MTNGEWLRQLDDKQLAKVLHKGISPCVDEHFDCTKDEKCEVYRCNNRERCMLGWLQSERTEDTNP